MRRFWDNGLSDKENMELEGILQGIPTFDEWADIPAGGISPSQDDIDEYERRYGDIIRAARDAVTE
jgi:hypothetical protein